MIVLIIQAENCKLCRYVSRKDNNTYAAFYYKRNPWQFLISRELIKKPEDSSPSTLCKVISQF